jgi:adenylyltransferase/sulfurtransferase
MPIVPGKSGCLRCMMGGLPAPGSSPTCDTAGVIGPITHIIASIQAAEAIKWIINGYRTEDIGLITYDVWSQRYHRSITGTDAMKTCPLCAEGRYDYLEGSPLRAVTLCGRNSVQLIPAVKGDLNFSELSRSLGNSGIVQYNEFLLRCTAPPFELTLFKDGRAIVKGTEDAGVARSVYTKMVGV